MRSRAPERIGDGEGPTLAERLKAAREARGISQSQAARELEVARTAYRLWEMEAARPAPDRWRLLARWLRVPMTTLLMAEGLISEAEEKGSEAASTRYEEVTGETPDVATEREPGDFFQQAETFIGRSVERGLLSEEEAEHFRSMFERVGSALGPDPTS